MRNTSREVSARKKNSSVHKRHLLDDKLVGHDGDVVIRNSLRCPDGALCGGKRRTTKEERWPEMRQEDLTILTLVLKGRDPRRPLLLPTTLQFDMIYTSTVTAMKLHTYIHPYIHPGTCRIGERRATTKTTTQDAAARQSCSGYLKKAATLRFPSSSPSPCLLPQRGPGLQYCSPVNWRPVEYLGRVIRQNMKHPGFVGICHRQSLTRLTKPRTGKRESDLTI